MKRFPINASTVVILGLGIGLVLLWVLGGGSTPIAAAPVLSADVPSVAQEPVLSGVEGSTWIADVSSAIEGPRAGGHIEALVAPAAELTSALAAAPTHPSRKPWTLPATAT